MKSMEDILSDMEDLSNAQHLKSYREIESLPQLLDEYEYIEYMTIAKMKENKGILTITDERILFLYLENGYSRFFQIDFDSIRYIYHQYEGLFGEVEFILEQSKVLVTDIAQHEIKPLVELLEDYIFSTSSNTESEKGESFFNIVAKCIGYVFIIAIILGVGSSLVLEWFASEEEIMTEDYETSGLSPEKAMKEYQLDISALTVDKTDGVITGAITNKAEFNYESLYVDVELYDKDGKLIDTDIERVEHVVPGETWNLDFYYTDKEVEQAKIIGVSAYTE